VDTATGAAIGPYRKSRLIRVPPAKDRTDRGVHLSGHRRESLADLNNSTAWRRLFSNCANAPGGLMSHGIHEATPNLSIVSPKINNNKRGGNSGLQSMG
jgi:hypothetical protein